MEAWQPLSGVFFASIFRIAAEKAVPDLAVTSVGACRARKKCIRGHGRRQMFNRLIASIAMSCAVVVTGSALAQDLPKQSFKVVGTWSNLTNWQQNEQPFWA